MKKHVIYVVSILGFSQANADVIKCVDESGYIWYSNTGQKTLKELMSILACENTSKYHSSTEELQQRTQKLFADKTAKEREEAYSKLAKIRAIRQVEAEEANYRIKVREMAKFLDDVEAARKRK
jgi:hypothetical protein